MEATGKVSVEVSSSSYYLTVDPDMENNKSSTLINAAPNASFSSFI